MSDQHGALGQGERICAILVTLVLVFSITRYAVDGVALPIMGRSLSQGGDFQTYYIAAAMLRAGEDMYDHRRALQFTAAHSSVAYPEVQYYLYPPLLAIVLSPLSTLPYPLAYKVWVVINQIFLAGTLLLLSKSLPMFQRWSLPILVILAGNMYPFYLSIDIGQINILILLLITAAFASAFQQRMFLAGVMIGIAAMIKISPLLLIGLFVFQRQWKAIWGFAASLALLTVFTALVAEPQSLAGFIHVSLMNSIPIQVDWIDNASPAAFLHRLTGALNIAPLEPGLRWLATLIVLSVLGLCSLPQRSTNDPTFGLLFGLWVLGMHLLSPITWEHHLVWTLLVVAVTAGYLVHLNARRTMPLAIVLAISYMLIAFENLTLNRLGQWQFKRGWWFLSGDYLREYFFADVRLVALVILFGFIAALVFQSNRTLYRRRWFNLASVRPALKC